MNPKSNQDLCARCGKLRRQVGVLIRHKDGYVCDRCVEERNKEALKDLEAPDLEAGQEGDAESTGSLTEEGESEEMMDQLPISPLDLDRLDALRRQHSDIPRIDDLSIETIDPEAVALVPRAVAEQFCLIPISKEGKRLKVAFSDPDDEEALKEVQYFTSLDINVVMADEMEIEAAIEKYYE